MSNINRKHPVSIAVSMALLAAATAAMATEPAGAPAENAGAPQDVPATPVPPPDIKKAKADQAAKEAAKYTSRVDSISLLYTKKRI